MIKLKIGDVITLKKGIVVNGDLMEMFVSYLSPVSKKNTTSGIIIGNKYSFNKQRAEQYLNSILEKINDNIELLSLDNDSAINIRKIIYDNYDKNIQDIKLNTFVLQPNEFVITKVEERFSDNIKYFTYYCKPLKDGKFDINSNEYHFSSDNYHLNNITINRTLQQVFI